MTSSEIIIPIMKFCYHKLPTDNGIEEFDYYVNYTDKFKTKIKKKADKWCQKNCEKKHIMRKYGCWFQTREDATAFKLKWL